MNLCSQCGYALKDEAKFCLKCGSPINKSSFCSKCGSKLEKGASFCSGCGYQAAEASSPQYIPPLYSYAPVHDRSTSHYLLQSLSQRIRTAATIWLIIGCLQTIAGVIYLVASAALYLSDAHKIVEGSAVGFVFIGFCFLIVGIMNLSVSVQNFRYSHEFQTRPIEIVQKFEPIGGIIATLIFNLCFGGIIGVIGSIYTLIAIRGFVLENAHAFRAAEQDFQTKGETFQMVGEDEPLFTGLPAGYRRDEDYARKRR